MESEKYVLDKLGSYLAAFGNHEGKCLALLGFSNTQEILDKDKLTRRVGEMTNSARRLYPNTIGDYCEYSFRKRGLVTREAHGYKLTEVGLAGQPMAGYLLLEGSKQERSLYDFFGATQSTSNNRSPLDSFIVLRIAVMAESITPNEIATRAGMELSTVSGNLKRLRKHRIVEYTRASIDTPGSVRYKIKNSCLNEEPRSKNNDTSLTQDIWSILKEHEGEELSYDGIESLIREDPIFSLSKYALSQSLRERVSNILASLYRQGLLEKNIRGVSIPNQIKQFIGEVFPKLISFIEGNPIIVEEFNNAKTVVLGTNEGNKIRADAMEKAREKSPWSPDNRESMEIRFQAVRNYLLQHPNARPFEISAILGISKENVLRALKKITEEESDLVRTKVGRATRYRIGN